MVRSRSNAGGDAEQGIKGSMPCPAPIEAEHELIKVVLQVGFPQSVVDAEAPTFEV